MTQRIDKSLIADENAQLLSDLNEDYQALGNKLWYSICAFPW